MIRLLKSNPQFEGDVCRESKFTEQLLVRLRHIERSDGIGGDDVLQLAPVIELFPGGDRGTKPPQQKMISSTSRMLGRGQVGHEVGAAETVVPINRASVDGHIHQSPLPTDSAECATQLWLDGNYDKAFRLGKLAADAGVPLGMSLVGILYRDGRGIPRDEREATRWLRRAAEAGHTSAMVNLGCMCADGRGTRKDEGEAARWFRRAADNGNLTASYNLGLLHWFGCGVHQDDEEAVYWFRKAAEGGEIGAMDFLGFAYEVGRGVIKNEENAALWKEKVAKSMWPEPSSTVHLVEGTNVPPEETAA